MKLRLFGFFVIFASLLFGLAVFGYVRLDDWSRTVITLDEPEVVELPRGTSLAVLSRSLEQAGLLKHPYLFQLWVRVESDYSRFQAGSYRFEGEVSPQVIVDKLVKGESFTPVAFEYTIPEGYTAKQTIERLVARGVGSRGEFEALISSKTFLASLKIPGDSIEGYLYPATYSFTEMPDAQSVLRTAVETFWKKLPKNYEENVRSLGLSLDEAVRFASLIELETPHDDERPMISEVIWRRLRDRIPLAIDAAIIYGIPDYTGDLTFKHLKDASNPYNLRIHSGLPPTAIGSPSLASLQAVFTPSHVGYYFYVLDPKSGTRHHFSRSAGEHNKRVQELLKHLKHNKTSEQR